MRVPEAALVLLRKSEALRTQRGNLEIIVHKYNSVLAGMADIERGLLQPHLESADAALEKGIVHLSWKSHGIGEFVTQAMTNVKELSAMLTTIHVNAREIDRIVTKWGSLLLVSILLTLFSFLLLQISVPDDASFDNSRWCEKRSEHIRWKT